MSSARPDSSACFSFVAQLFELLVKEIAEQQAVLLQAAVHFAGHAGRARVGGDGAAPHFGEQDLQRGRDGGIAIGEIVGDGFGQFGVDGEVIEFAQAAGLGEAGDDLGDGAGIDGFEEDLAVIDGRFLDLLLKFREPLLAEGEDDAAGECADGGDELGEFVRGGGAGNGVRLFDLIEEDDERFAGALFGGQPACGEAVAGVERLLQGVQQAALGIAAEVERLIMPLEAGDDAGIEEGRLADAGLAVEQREVRRVGCG